MKIQVKKQRTVYENAAIDVMRHNMQYQEEPLVGIFWYDVNNDELFGVQSTPAREAQWYSSPQFGKKVKTEARLHKQIWQKEFFKKKDKRFFGDHTLTPRGRIFEFEDEGFKVYTGDWIDNYPNVKDLILYEFQLPEENTEFVKDFHWDIGHGWSDEF